jgi:molybdopterin molybdotransferase
MPGEAVRIMTGAPMPPGADCMTPKEMVREDGAELLLSRPLSRHENYVFQGEDIKRGESLIEEGTRLGFAHLGLLAAMGRGTAVVYRPPLIGLCCIGDELLPPDTPLTPGKIYGSNGTLLAARLAEYGLPCRPPVTGEDDPDVMAAKIAGMMGIMEGLDILITTGSVSVGDKDVMGEVFAILGIEPVLGRLDFKPGSVFLCGRYREKWIFCLSGNPFAALTTMELVVRPALAVFARRKDLNTTRRNAILRTPFPGGKSSQRRFVRGRLEDINGGLPTVTLPEGHSSGRLFSLVGCNCLVDISADTRTLPEGAEVTVVPLGVWSGSRGIGV